MSQNLIETLVSFPTLDLVNTTNTAQASPNSATPFGEHLKQAEVQQAPDSAAPPSRPTSPADEVAPPKRARRSAPDTDDSSPEQNAAEGSGSTDAVNPDEANSDEAPREEDQPQDELVLDEASQAVSDQGTFSAERLEVPMTTSESDQVAKVDGAKPDQVAPNPTDVQSRVQAELEVESVAEENPIGQDDSPDADRPARRPGVKAAEADDSDEGNLERKSQGDTKSQRTGPPTASDRNSTPPHSASKEPTDRSLSPHAEKAPTHVSTDDGSVRHDSDTRRSPSGNPTDSAPKISPVRGGTANSPGPAIDRPLTTPTALRGHATFGEASGHRSVDQVRFVQRVARAFQSGRLSGRDIQLRLNPPELGHLRLEVNVEDGVMTARMEAETSAARALLLDNLPAPRDRLAEQNIKIDRFDVDLADQQPGSARDRSAGDAHSDRQPGRSSASSSSRSEAAGKNDPLAVGQPSVSRGDEQLNIVI